MLCYLRKSPAAETLPHMSDRAINSANKQVEIELKAKGNITHSYSDEMKTKIRMYGAEMAILML